MTVLILTCDQDVTADLVVAELGALNVPLIRLDPADLPGRAALSAEYARGDFHGFLSVDERMVSTAALRSVWVRRPGAPAAGSPEASEWLTAETRQALYGVLYSTGARWMNHPAAAEQARYKPWQLRLAHRSGFAVPPTVVTTFPRVAEEFTARYRRVVVKTLSGPPRDGATRMEMPTALVGPEADFTDVALGPTLLQRYVPKTADIRLTSVGGRLFAARKVSAPGQVDGRYGDTGHAWEPAEVPDRIARAVRAYTEAAGLAYAAFDFAEDAEDTDGVWWFLECNQGGQFGFVELATGQPIARAVASWLAGPS
ncbi:ATP-grasp ribosomal peptide maturase [Streptomyces sp. TRM49041]|uniref:ATP-grasp ribosomal peptide maturase n=1 Tax=Streptomyces sp. TRM49041 TaxID=2603216 RepID=UPI0011EED1F8|nr:ATP-grasp ribosomal peptide maturase [Streptomyces sp. TRM49041]